jgi:hypothetical protein
LSATLLGKTSLQQLEREILGWFRAFAPSAARYWLAK